MKISEFEYPLPDDRIAKFPAPERDGAKLLLYRGGVISQDVFRNVGAALPEGALLVFNNTKVIRARIIMHKPSGARIEVFCLEPAAPADYERAFAVKGSCEWHCMAGNLKKWKDGPLEMDFTLDGGANGNGSIDDNNCGGGNGSGSVDDNNCGGTTNGTDNPGAKYKLRAWRGARQGNELKVRFEWDARITFGELLEHLGRIPIPPYLGRDSEDIDNTRYQTVYSRFDGSVAAPTAGLHFTPELIGRMQGAGYGFEEVTLHVGAGTFLPVKEENADNHIMHTEHFEVTLPAIRSLISHAGRVIPVGTTSVRTLESLTALGYRIMRTGAPEPEKLIGQWEPYDIPAESGGAELLTALAAYMEREGMDKIKAATRIMIRPGYRFRVIDGMITNFHQPGSTLLLLVSAFIGGDWKRVYDYALANGFRFLSYGDSSLLLK